MVTETKFLKIAHDSDGHRYVAMAYNKAEKHTGGWIQKKDLST